MKAFRLTLFLLSFLSLAMAAWGSYSAAFEDEPEPSERDLKILDAFLIAKEYIGGKDSLPSQDEMNAWFESYSGENEIVGGLIYERASDERYLPGLMGEIPQGSYILAYWRSEWMEEFAPWSGKTTMCSVENNCYSFSTNWYWIVFYLLISLLLAWWARITKVSN